MAISVLATALRHARDSWRGQLVVLGIGVLVNALLALVGVGWMITAPLVALVLLALGARMASAAPSTAPALVDELRATLLLVPRVLAQVAVALLPAAALGYGTLQLSSAMPLVGLLLVVAMFPVVLVAWLLALLSIVAVVRGDGAWLPGIAAVVVRRRTWPLLLAALVGLVVVAMGAVPVVLTGFILTAVLGPLGDVGIGLAMAWLGPLTGCWALALWQHAGGDTVVRERHTRVDDELVAAFAQPTTGGWVASGPSWEVQVAPGVPWGTWVRLPADANVALQVTWSAGPPPQLAIAREDGVWSHPGDVVASGAPIPTTLAAGNSYLQLSCTGMEAQQVVLALLVPGAAAA